MDAVHRSDVGGSSKMGLVLSLRQACLLIDLRYDRPHTRVVKSDSRVVGMVFRVCQLVVWRLASSIFFGDGVTTL